VKKVAEIYKQLDSRIRQSIQLAGMCSACGQCCDFKNFDHKLFVTEPELIYLAASLSSENIKPMKTGRCPYNVEDKCSIYEHRFSGCRIFCCKGDKDFQSRLSEDTLKEFKALCTEFHIPYRYIDLATALNNFSTG